MMTLFFIQEVVSKTSFTRTSDATRSNEALDIMKKQFGGYDNVVSIKDKLVGENLIIYE